VAADRKERLQKLLNLKAPEIIIISAAEQYLRSFRRSWRGTWQHFKINRLPGWILWLIDQDYRKVCREPLDPELEAELRELSRMRKSTAKRAGKEAK
jgi:hypothetical protein